MKKTLLAIAMLSISGGAFASAGTITFMGAVTDQTCSISVEGVADPTIVLQPATAASLKTPGSSAGLRTFEVQISGCTASKAGIQFVPIAANTKDGYLINTVTEGSGAKNVGFQLLDGGKVMNLSSASQSDMAIVKSKSGEASDPFSATIPVGVQYYSASGNATAGAVQSSIQYAITYQ